MTLNPVGGFQKEAIHDIVGVIEVGAFNDIITHNTTHISSNSYVVLE